MQVSPVQNIVPKKTTTERRPDTCTGNDWTYLEVAIFLFYSVTRQLKTPAGSDFAKFSILLFSVLKRLKKGILT